MNITMGNESQAILRLHPRQQTVRYAVHWRDIGSNPTRLGAQNQSSSRLCRAPWVDQLVWFEVHATAEAAITREKQIKEWKRDWKINLIMRDNPDWADLYSTICT
jgi:predicted GIY-YIG superfamily endonuclease